MKTARKPAKKRASKSEWLGIVEALDRLMKSRIFEEDGAEATVKRGFNKMILASLNEAYAATLRYYAELLGGGIRSRKPEVTISGFWRQTGRLLRHYDPALSACLTSRNGCWSDDSTWSPATIQKAWLGLNSIRVSANMMDPDRRTLERWSTRL